MADRGRRLTFLLGLPTLSDGPLWRAACRLGAPVLLSANALSVWRRDPAGLRDWCGFTRRNLHLVWTHPVHLDSGGFVSAVRYRGFPWTVDAYLDLCAAAPWQWFASADMCVEPEIARDRAAVFDRIAGTVRLNRDCLMLAQDREIEDRFVPVIQGWQPDDYLRCLDRMPFIDGCALVGVGSMCRRHVEGENGILRVVDALDRALGSSPAQLHLFGVKTTGMAEIANHSRVASVDSQAYGMAARQDTRKRGVVKSNAYLAGVMTDWYRRQKAILDAASDPFRAPKLPHVQSVEPTDGVLPPHLAAAFSDAMEELRSLHEAGEIEWADVTPERAWACVFS